jgi:uncharacterized protein (UPF0147 family)
MFDTHAMKRLFNLYLIFLKTSDSKDQITLKNEVDFLYQEVVNDVTIPDAIKKAFNDILYQYTIIYKSCSYDEQLDAEERVLEIIDNLRKMLKEEK